jgi:hypothetical protein
MLLWPHRPPGMAAPPVGARVYFLDDKKTINPKIAFLGWSGFLFYHRKIVQTNKYYLITFHKSKYYPISMHCFHVRLFGNNLGCFCIN